MPFVPFGGRYPRMADEASSLILGRLEADGFVGCVAKGLRVALAAPAERNPTATLHHFACAVQHFDITLDEQGPVGADGDGYLVGSGLARIGSHGSTVGEMRTRLDLRPARSRENEVYASGLNASTYGSRSAGLSGRGRATINKSTPASR